MKKLDFRLKSIRLIAIILILFIHSCSDHLDFEREATSNKATTITRVYTEAIDLDTLNNLKQDPEFNNLVYIWSAAHTIAASDSLSKIATDSIHYRHLALNSVKEKLKAVKDYSLKRYGTTNRHR